jgi:hypothetical protein
MQALQARYNGCHFRSRLEARWAVFFDAAAIRYSYEPEGFDLGGLKYLPDFYLPELGFYVEIKGERPDGEEQEKARRLSGFTGKPVFLFFGDIPTRNDLGWPNGAYQFRGGLYLSKGNAWTECVRCKRLSVGGEGEGSCIELFEGDDHNPAFTRTTERLLAAYEKARSYRFEERQTSSGPAPAVETIAQTIEREALRTRGDIPARARAAEQIAQRIARLDSPTERDLYLKILAERLGVSGSILRRTANIPDPPFVLSPRPLLAREPAPKHEILVAALLFVHPHLRPKARELGIHRFVVHEGARALFARLEDASPEARDTEVLASVTDEALKRDLLAVLAQPLGLEDEPEKAEGRLISSANFLYRKALEQEILEVETGIKVAKAEGDEDRVFTLLDRLAKLRKAAKTLTERLQVKSPAPASH